MFSSSDRQAGRLLMVLGKQNSLEFQLRLQQYIELRRGGKLLEARQHAQKHIAPHTETHSADIYTAASMLAFPPDTQAEPYKVVSNNGIPFHYVTLIWLIVDVFLIKMGQPGGPLRQNPP